MMHERTDAYCFYLTWHLKSFHTYHLTLKPLQYDKRRCTKVVFSTMKNPKSPDRLDPVLMGFEWDMNAHGWAVPHWSHTLVCLCVSRALGADRKTWCVWLPLCVTVVWLCLRMRRWSWRALTGCQLTWQQSSWCYSWWVPPTVVSFHFITFPNIKADQYKTAR